MMAKNCVDDLHGMFIDLQYVRKESRSMDIAVLEDLLHQMLREWKVELNKPSPASSLQVCINFGSIFSYCLWTCMDGEILWSMGFNSDFNG